MSQLIEDFRRSHTKVRPKPSRLIPKMLTALGGLVVLGVLVLQGIALLTPQADDVSMPVLDSTQVLPERATVAVNEPDELVTGSLTPMASSGLAVPAEAMPARSIYVAGWALLTGLLVFLGLNYALVDDSSPPEDVSNLRLRDRPIALRNGSRRQGGPIRN